MKDKSLDKEYLVQLIRKKLLLLIEERRNPDSTYRLQFHSGFTFTNASEITSYLRNLGITHCYASPFLKAKPGSTHGYDITDHNTINPDVGSESDFNNWIKSLSENNLGLILDIVPNHMGIATNENVWWNDVLENGE